MPQEHSDTPPPRRFVLQKRQPGTTPLAQSSVARTGTAQFQTTRRFGFSTSTARPRPTTAQSYGTNAVCPTLPNASPFPPSNTTWVTQARDPIHDSFSPSPPAISPIRPAPRGTQDSIEAESPVPCSQVDVVAETPLGVERPSKRRRLSISSHGSSIDLASPSADRQRPIPDTSRRPGQGGAYDINEESDSGDEKDNVSPTQAPILEQDDNLEPSQKTKRAAPTRERHSTIIFRAGLGPKAGNIGAAAAFHAAPRFVHVEKGENLSGIDNHHEVFSPPRRGEKYVRGGLASELGQWITNSLPNSGCNKTVIVSDVRDGDDMQLLRAHVAEQKHDSGGGPEAMDLDNEGEGNSARGPEVNILLGGEGVTDGKGRHRALETGSNLVLSPPMWDVEIAEHRWRVAYNWHIKPK